jgi:Mn2+/Fe2+ NRAMP family transporter
MLGLHRYPSSQAAEALRPIAGVLTFALFATGIIATGMRAVPVLAGSATYAVSEVFRWTEGLDRLLTELGSRNSAPSIHGGQ